MAKTRPQILLNMVAVLCMASVLMADDKKESANAKPMKDPGNQFPLVKPPAKFEQLKQLVGKWKGTQKTPEGEKKVNVEYSLTSAGTVLTEKLFPGTSHEMFSLYHGDKDRILMTHYCALGNQPRMKLEKSDNSKVMKFVYIDGTSMKSIKDPHMHQLTITIIDKNHITHDWIFFSDGKKQMAVKFDLKRNKK